MDSRVSYYHMAVTTVKGLKFLAMDLGFRALTGKVSHRMLLQKPMEQYIILFQFKKKFAKSFTEVS